MSGIATDVLIERLGTLTDPGYAEEHRALLSEAEDSWPLRGGEECRVGAVATSEHFEALVAGLLEVFDENEVIHPEGVAVTELKLDGRDVARLDYARSDPELPSIRVGSHHLWVENGRYYYISCLGDQAPDDRWLSIVRTFEILAAEE